MGIYDRDYYRDDREGFRFHGPRTVIGALLLVNIGIWLVDRLASSQSGMVGTIGEKLALHVASLTHWQYLWQLLTYGFIHASRPDHILLNLFTLWMFGRDIESKYGAKEFLRLYLFLIVASGLIWAVVNRLSGTTDASVVGASGAVVGVVMLYALNFPRRTVLLFFILPAPAWVMGVLLIVANLAESLGVAQSLGTHGSDSFQVACSVHLAGAVLAYLYFRFHWNLGRLVPRGWSLDWLKPRTPLRIHDPAQDQEEPQDPDADLGEEVDRILEKIHREGEARLTRKERRTLVNASRQYQRKRQGDPRR
jgi:membrane associated rhomboid family serine protease